MMISLTHLNGEPFVLNSEYIETIESKPDTVITLFNGRKHIVRESVDDVIERVIEYRKKVTAPFPSTLPKEGE